MKPAASSRVPLNTSLAIKLILTAFFWGGAFIAGKVVAQALPNLTAASIRFVIAGALLLIVIRKSEGGLPRLTWSQCGLTALQGLVGIFIYSICFFKALALIPAGRTALFVSIYPVVTSLAACLIFGERLSKKRWLGVVLTLIGTGIVITHGNVLEAVHDVSRSFGTGEALMTLAILCWSAYSLLSQKSMETLTPMATTTYAILWGALFLTLSALPELMSVHWAAVGWEVWASLLYLSAVCIVVCLVWYYQGINTIGASRSSVFANLVPIFGVLLASVVLGEPILLSMIIGGALTIVGVYLTNQKTA